MSDTGVMSLFLYDQWIEELEGKINMWNPSRSEKSVLRNRRDGLLRERAEFKKKMTNAEYAEYLIECHRNNKEAW